MTGARGQTGDRLTVRSRAFLIAVCSLVVGTGCASDDGSGDFAARRAADGRCPEPVPGAYVGVAEWGENSCGFTGRTSQTVFLSSAPKGLEVGGAVADPEYCIVDIDATVNGDRFQGSNEYASSTHFRFVGTIRSSDCTANVVVTYTKQ